MYGGNTIFFSDVLQQSIKQIDLQNVFNSHLHIKVTILKLGDTGFSLLY